MKPDYNVHVCETAPKTRKTQQQHDRSEETAEGREEEMRRRRRKGGGESGRAAAVATLCVQASELSPVHERGAPRKTYTVGRRVQFVCLVVVRNVVFKGQAAVAPASPEGRRGNLAAAQKVVRACRTGNRQCVICAQIV